MRLYQMLYNNTWQPTGSVLMRGFVHDFRQFSTNTVIARSRFGDFPSTIVWKWGGRRSNSPSVSCTARPSVRNLGAGPVTRALSQSASAVMTALLQAAQIHPS